MTRRPRAVPVTAAALAVCAAFGSIVLPASADTLGDARARAAALARTVDRLQTRAEVLTERYDAVEAALGRAVVRQSLADRAAEADQAAVDDAAATIDDRVRALYEAGGAQVLLTTVLDGAGPADTLDRLHIVGSVLAANDAVVRQAQAVTGQARRLAAHLSSVASRVTELQKQAASGAVRIRTLLARQQAALASAGAEVRRLAAARAAAEAAASAQQFQVALQSAGGSLGGGTTPPNDIAAGAIAAARTRLGDPYVWGATGPNSFDCSGLTQWSYAHVGIQLPRVAADQWNAGPHVPLDALEPGDLLFWATDLSNPATIHHVAIYLGNGLMLAAPHTGTVVQVQPVYLQGYIGATRPYRTTG